MRRRRIAVLFLGLVGAVSVACLGGDGSEDGEATVTPTPAPTEAASPTATASPTSTPRPTASPTAPAGDPDEHSAAGSAATSRGDWQGAIDAYTLAIELRPSFEDYSGRANAYGRLGASERAIADWTEAIALDGEIAAAYNQRAFHYNELGQWAAAVVDLDRAIELRPDRADQYNGRAFAHLNLGNWAEVVADMDAALELAESDDPLIPIYLSNRASAYEELGEFELALADFTRSLELDPTNLTSHQNLIGLFISMERLEDARAAATSFAELLGVPGAAHLLLSDLLRQAGRPEEAIAELGLAIELDPESAILHMARAFHLHRDGRDRGGAHGLRGRPRADLRSAVAGGDRVGARRARRALSVSGRRRLGVLSLAVRAGEEIAVAAAGADIGAAGAAVEYVQLAAAGDGVIARAAGEHVRAGVAVDEVVATAAEDAVIAAAAADRVGDRAPDDQFVRGGAVEDPAAADDRGEVDAGADCRLEFVRRDRAARGARRRAGDGDRRRRAAKRGGPGE